MNPMNSAGREQAANGCWEQRPEEKRSRTQSPFNERNLSRNQLKSRDLEGPAKCFQQRQKQEPSSSERADPNSLLLQQAVMICSAAEPQQQRAGLQDMEDSRDPKNFVSSHRWTSSNERSAPPEQSQADSFLTAARIAREGLLEDGWRTGQCSTHKAPQSNSQQNHAAFLFRDIRVRRYSVISREKMENKEEKQNPEGSKTPAGRQKAGWFSGCRQPARFKVAVLPVITEV
ncbi:PREDICTED: uncharacterized protein LOC107091187 [Cyprinodon variegatus]|uniref:uncharacterized protein LOC107091187 n=1 Tax=Cyprinodon variegatus TaxID=28743 RepID=UPI000742BC38|nr:PREDICTED: uncharacterized protein LOC107091187 [Cyprinodon variegatus]